MLAAAGHRVSKRSRGELPVGLTERELEVLLVLVRGESNQEIAEDLGISAKTVGHHVQHVYQKAGGPQPDSTRDHSQDDGMLHGPKCCGSA